MAITETATDPSPETPSTPAEPAAAGFPLPAPAGLVGVFGSGDHKTLGRIWIAASGAFGLGSLLLFGWYLVEASRDAASQTDRASQNLSLAALGLVLGFAVPMLLGLATAVVPLQVGASTIAFPRAAAAALWAWLTAALLLAVSYLPSMGGGIGGTKVDGSVLTYLALIGVVAALLLGTICVMTTVVTLRPPGMTLDRVPMFSWSMLVAGGLWLLTLPMLAAGALFIVVDLKYGTPSLFGARDLQWTQMCWILFPPQAFAFAIPVLGIAGDTVATFAKQRQPQRGVVLGAIGVFGALSFGVYTQPAYDRFAFRQWPLVVQVAILVLPLLVVLGGFVTALRRGARAMAGPLVLGLLSVVLLVIGALAAIPFVIGPFELQSTNAGLMKAVPALRLATSGPPVYTWGVFAIVMVAAATGAAAGLFHWSSKITGRQMPDGIAKLLAPVLLVAALLFGGPLLVLGFAQKASGLVDAASVLFALSIAGALLAALAVAVPVALTLLTRVAVIGGRATVDADPWGSGTSLEWATDSPPAEGNFGELALVTSPEPLLDLNDGGAS